jgi:Rrf2 family protein
MLRISKKVEYAVLSLEYISSIKGELITAKELAEKLNIDFEFLSKVMQHLKNNHIIRSKKGKGGGYEVLMPLEEITLKEIIQAVENKDIIPIVDCLENLAHDACLRAENCNLRNPFLQIQNKIMQIFEDITVHQLINMK